MGMAVSTRSFERTLLASAITLAIGGFASLVCNTNGAVDHAPRILGPHSGAPASGSFDTWLSTTTSMRDRLRARGGTWVSGDYIDVPTDMPPGSTTTTGPQSGPPTQVRVGVPAAGLQVSAGQGPGSCTDVAITALTPDSCSPALGGGPVNVDPGPASGLFRPGGKGTPA